LISGQKVDPDAENKEQASKRKEKKMLMDTVGFIGGGRITQILLQGLARAGQMPEEIVISDPNEKVIQVLQKNFQGIHGVVGNNHLSAAQGVVFLALHPPAILTCLEDIRACLDEEAVIISLAPKLTIKQLSDRLSGFQRIIRMIPNAPSFLNAGYNPVTFSPVFSLEEKEGWLSWFRLWGESPVVLEDNLEAYAIITAMGPTYLWFQLYELLKIAKSFGLEQADALRGISGMAVGAVKCMLEEDRNAEEVMDLIPVKPLLEEEPGIKEIYHRNLEALYHKLTA
jgi:pyrroline-5-carboxylate reductase